MTRIPHHVTANVVSTKTGWTWWAVSKNGLDNITNHVPLIDRSGTAKTEAEGWAKVMEAVVSVYGKEPK